MTRRTLFDDIVAQLESIAEELTADAGNREDTMTGIAIGQSAYLLKRHTRNATPPDLAKAQEFIEAQKRTIEGLQAEMDAYIAERDDVPSAINRLRAKVKEAEKELARLRESIESKDRDLYDAQASADHWRGASTANEGIIRIAHEFLDSAGFRAGSLLDRIKLLAKERDAYREAISRTVPDCTCEADNRWPDIRGLSTGGFFCRSCQASAESPVIPPGEPTAPSQVAAQVAQNRKDASEVYRKERDELRAEVERLRLQIDDILVICWPEGYEGMRHGVIKLVRLAGGDHGANWIEGQLDKAESLGRQRDELEAEVERLRRELAMYGDQTELREEIRAEAALVTVGVCAGDRGPCSVPGCVRDHGEEDGEEKKPWEP